MSTETLVCDDCGTLNAIGLKQCSLCNNSLAEEEERRRAGDYRYLLIASIVSTMIVCFLLYTYDWAGQLAESGRSSERANIHSGDIVTYINLGFILLSVGLWRGTYYAFKIRK
ncbi:MAG: hypothetical protein VYE40_12395 [Myxococcota bacterium]|nr:hypothetical protein [Myxococcota bacterium]